MIWLLARWRLVAGVVLAGALVALGWRVAHWRTQAARVGQLEQEVAAAKQETEDVRAEKRAGAIRRYHLEIGRGADLGPAPVVRLCGPSIVLPAEPAPGADGTAPEADGVRAVRPGDPGAVDVGGELVGLLRAADRVSARLRAAQELAGPADLF